MKAGAVAPAFIHIEPRVFTLNFGYSSVIPRVFGRGSKILLLRRVCCLCPWRVSSGLRQRQQNPASEARLLPLSLASFIGSSAEAANSCFLRRDCCLWSWWALGSKGRQPINADWAKTKTFSPPPKSLVYINVRALEAH